MFKRNRITLFVLIITALLLATGACNRPYDAVFSTYPNGGKKLVFIVIDGKHGELTRVGEKMYYENGKMMYGKHFNGDKPCGDWTFYYDNGNIHAKGNFDQNDSIGSNWSFFNKEGGNFFPEQYDSLRIMELTADHRPLSIVYYKDNTEWRFRFNDNYTVNTRGRVVDGRKEGRWEFFYANGQIMLEANYSGDVENGIYNSYRENGIPYFRGYYINGKRANIWEIYDEEGNLVSTQDFDAH